MVIIMVKVGSVMAMVKTSALTLDPYSHIMNCWVGFSLDDQPSISVFYG